MLTQLTEEDEQKYEDFGRVVSTQWQAEMLGIMLHTFVCTYVHVYTYVYRSLLHD